MNFDRAIYDNLKPTPGDILGFCKHQDRHDDAIKAQDFGKNQNEDHANIQSRLLRASSNCRKVH